MRWGPSSPDKSPAPAALLVFALAGGLLGFFFEIHQAFLAAASVGIPGRTAGGFAVAFAVSLALGFGVDRKAGPGLRRVLQKGTAAFCQAAMFAALGYIASILFRNTAFLFRWDGLMQDILLVYPAFAGVTLLVAIGLRLAVRGSPATASLLTFLLFAAYVLVRTGSIVGAGIALLYCLYLVMLGRFAAGGLARLLGVPLASALETLLVSFVGGILINYVLWYAIGRLGLLYPATAWAVVPTVTAAGLFRYGRSSAAAARAAFVDARTTLETRPSPTTAVLLNVTLFCLLVLVAVLTIRFPGNADSSARMYCATVYKFAEMHRIVFPPFYQHWPLIFQPLLVEVTGLPPFLFGGITALRFFHGTVYFSFIPFLILLCRRYGLPQRTIVVFVLILMSSSFSFCLAYFDKPSVLAFPAFIALLAVCLVMLKVPGPWLIVLAGMLTATIAGAKLVLLHGAVAALAALGIALLFGRVRQAPAQWRRSILVAVGIVVVVGSVHAIQNFHLRGNPLHPFAAGIFKSSADYPEELKFADVPRNIYHRTMPNERPSQISTINVDPSRGMYRPYVHDSPDRGGRGYGISKMSVTVAVILTAILLPVILLIRADRITVYCTVVAAISFFVWFGWIGDGWRYSTFFPGIALLSAVLVSRPLLPNRHLDRIWRHLFLVLLVGSIPLGLYFTAGLPTSRHLYDFLRQRGKMHESLAPAPHVVTSHLQAQRASRPILLVADLEVSQYGFFQPNFLYQPIHWRQDLFTNMVYLAEIRPTHLLTSRPLESSVLIEHYPFLSEHLVLEKDFRVPRQPMFLYRFDDWTPWQEWQAEYRQKEEHVPGHIADIKRVLDRYRR